MLSLEQYILEKADTKNKTSVTVEWLKENYAKFNERYFNNELPKDIKLEVRNEKTMPLKHCLGCQGFDAPIRFNSVWKNGRREWDMKDGMYQMYDGMYNIPKSISDLKPHIYMNSDFKVSDLQNEDTLIHEMIHLWVHRNCLSPKRAHGKEFKAKCNEVRKLAKEKYDESYWLTTYADNNETPEESEKEAKDMKIWRTNNVARLLYFRVKNEKNPDRLLFVRSKYLMPVMREIKEKHGDNLVFLTYVYDIYRFAVETYGNFTLTMHYKWFYKANEYDKIIEKIKEMSKNQNNSWAVNDYVGTFNVKQVDESKFTFQGEPNTDHSFCILPPDIDFSNTDIEEYIKKMLDDDEEIKGDPKNEKNIVQVD